MLSPAHPVSDYRTLVRQAKRLDTSACTRTVRVALLGDFATQQLATILPVVFAARGVRVELHEAEYDTIELEVFNPESPLYAFDPQIIVLVNATQRLRERYYQFGADKAGFVDATLQGLARVWDAIEARTSATILQSNFVLPQERLFGNYDHKVPESLYAAVQAINVGIAHSAQSRINLLVNDLEAVASDIGRRHWYDDRLWVLAKSLCALDHLPAVAQNIAQICDSRLGAGIKCIVLDLDETLWGGVIGDDGVDGIRLGHAGDGEAFWSFQCYLRELNRRGILLAVCSKNQHDNAIRPFREHPEMVLKEQDIAVFVANWNNKADNIRHIRETLNIGLDSMVFFDDNPFERNLVRELLPGITVPELPEDPSNYVRYIASLNLFETATYTELDRKRTEIYRQAAHRETERAQYSSIDDYLQSMEMKAVLARFDPPHLPRIAQLIQRSNQFNLTTRRHSEAECAEMMRDTEHFAPLWISLSDKHGDHGLILIAIVALRPDEVEIDTFLMSCRVLQRGVEQLAMNAIFDLARARGAKRVLGRFLPTAKNAMVRGFYAGFGFRAVEQAEDGSSLWEMTPSDYVPRTTRITVVQPEAGQ